MKRILLLVFCAIAVVASGEQLKIATLNIHYIYEGQTKMPWEARRDAVRVAIDEIDADIFAFQEMETFAGSHSNATNLQRDWIAASFEEYDFAATGDPSSFPNTQPIMYRRTRFRVLDEGFFFFSPEPDRIYSRPWHGRFSYYATWAIFEDRFGSGSSRFAVVNLHLDHSNRRDRRLAADLVIERARGLGDVPVLIAGDFNALASFRTITVFETSGYAVAPLSGATYHFGRGIGLYPAIDHVLYSPHWDVASTAVYREAPGGVWPSDHYPVVVDVRLR